MKLLLTHTFRDITLESYVKLFLSERFNAELLPQIDIRERRVLDRRQDGQLLYRRVQTRPNRDLPAVMKKFLGGVELAFVEDSTYDARTHQMSFEIGVPSMGDRVEVRGLVRFAAKPAGVERTIDGDINVRAFGAGAVIERFVLADIQQSYERIAAITQRWIDDKKPIPEE